jgi:hypothetical protein
MTRKEDRDAEADLKAQERGPANAKVGRTSRGYINATHPDTGLDVVFLPGELLPDWVELPPELEA